VLGLAPRGRTVGLFLLGTLFGLLLVGLWMGVFWLLVPFHLAPSLITAPELFCSAGIYLFGALLEELAFRGHALIRLKERYGTAAAILLVSFAFGLLHLPGMSGLNAIKIVALTGLSSVLFCLAYLLSGSLWAAVGLHAGMNFMLHSLAGAGGGRGPSLFVPVYEGAAPAAYDAAFWSLMLVQSAFAIGFLLLWPRLPANLRRQGR
jgi:membrane protease YdiL (CAAX protease family)